MMMELSMTIALVAALVTGEFFMGSSSLHLYLRRKCWRGSPLAGSGAQSNENPVDDHALSGNSSVEEAAITGEALPQDQLPDSRIFAGTLNQTGASMRA
jgi:cation transport ATPase